MSSITPRPDPVNGSKPRHEAVRGFPALRAFALAESAVKEGRAMWLSMSGGSCCPDDEPTFCRGCLEAARLVECPACAGLGLREPQVCERCGGSGEVDDDEPEVFVAEPFAPDDNPVVEPPPGWHDAADDEFEHPDADDGADRDADADAWDEDHVWNLTGPLHLTLAELAEFEAQKYKAWDTLAGDLFCERMTALAAQIRLFDAQDPETYRDRREVMLTHAVDAARARLASAGVDA